jgi:methylmalonyl-CoA carboxyltransferase large subunit
MREDQAGNIEVLLAEIRAQLRDLGARVSRLEEQRQADQAQEDPLEHAGSSHLPPPTATVVRQALPAGKHVISEERLVAISAAVAAFLGERVRIRQIRLIRSNAWAEQGRVSVQASHWLHR